MKTDDRFSEVENILSSFKEQIHEDYFGYKNHCIRVLIFLNYLRPLNSEEREKLIIATAFHDIGLWTKNTLDYLDPSIDEAAKYLKSIAKEEWLEEISTIISMHHKLSPYVGKFEFVELFRKADLTDFSLGTIRNGIPNDYIVMIKKELPNCGFHKMLVIRTLKWLPTHLHKPLPIFKW